MNLEEYEKLEQLKKDLDLGESWKIGHCWDKTSRDVIKCVFSEYRNVNSEYMFRCFHKIDDYIIMQTYECAKEVPKPKAPKYRPFKNYAEFVKHWPDEKRRGMYLKSGKAGMAGPLDRVTDSMDFVPRVINDKILTEEQVINEDYENGLPFGVLEND